MDRGVGGRKYDEEKDSDGIVTEFDRRVATVQVAARHNAAFHVSEQNFEVMDYFHHHHHHQHHTYNYGAFCL